MKPLSVEPAAIAQPSPQDLALSGSWTARGIGAIERRLESVRVPSRTEVIADGARIGEVKLQKWRDGWLNLTHLVAKRFGWM